MNQVLANILRPKKLQDIIGQKKLINEKDGVINRIIKNKFLPSMIFHGLPGTGKTSLAQVIGKELDLQVVVFNAAVDKKQKLEKIIEQIYEDNKYILVIEEIHRMNKDRQDLLLQYLEQGAVTLIACTSENPYFVVNNALRSRCLLVEFKPIANEEMFLGIKKIINENKDLKININDQALKMVCQFANGDLRVALNNLQLIINLYPDSVIDEKIIEAVSFQPNLSNFKEGNEIHDLKSALQKSIRGSDVDAAIYYLARMLASGDYEPLLRRLLIISYEDIGLANPALCARVKIAIDSFRELGMPEGMIPLSVVVCEMALSQKSTSAYNAVSSAYNDIMQGKSYSVPEYLKSSGWKKKDYKYPPNFKNSYVQQQYLPDEIKDVKYYFFKEYSTYEKKINELYDKFTNKK